MTDLTRSLRRLLIHAQSMAGKTPTTLDANGMYRAACREFADDLGWKRHEVWNTWNELVLVHRFHNRHYPWELCRELAFRCMQGALDKRGSLAS